MTEFAFKRYENRSDDPDEDRRGVHRKTDLFNYYPDGFTLFSHGNGPGQYLNDFVFVKVPQITFAQAQAADYRKAWRDDLDYEVTATRPLQGEYDIRVFEKNAGAINQNAIAGVKATKIRNYLLAWGCSNFALSETDGSFTFSLWDAVRSANFWEVPLLVFAGLSFQLNSYSSTTGVGNITVTVPVEVNPAEVIHRIEMQGGTVTVAIHPNYTFIINRDDILTKFKSDVKQRLEQVYMRHRYGISQTDHDAIVAAGGIVQLNRNQFLSKLIDKMAAT